jgi:hypothetical protein
MNEQVKQRPVKGHLVGQPAVNAHPAAKQNGVNNYDGVNNYVVKPFNAATLKTKIEAVFPDTVSA